MPSVGLQPNSTWLLEKLNSTGLTREWPWRSHENPPYQRGKEGEGEILRRFHAVAEPSGGCRDWLGKAGRTTPWRFATTVASRRPLC